MALDANVEANLHMIIQATVVYSIVHPKPLSYLFRLLKLSCQLRQDLVTKVMSSRAVLLGQHYYAANILFTLQSLY